MFKQLLAKARVLDDVAERVVLHVLWPGAKARSRWLALASVLFGLALLIQPSSTEVPAPTADAQSDAFLLDRGWIDNLRAGPRDRMSLWYFSSDGDGRGGLWTIFQKGAPTRATYEVFRMQPCNGKMRLRSLYDDRRIDLDYRLTRERNGKADLKLVIKNDPHHGGGEHTYWSRVDKWRREASDPGGPARAQLAAQTE